MPRLTSISWHELVQRLHHFGFEGPYRGGKHPYMMKGDFVLTIPNPHRREVNVDLLSRLLRQAGISRKQWLQQVDS